MAPKGFLVAIAIVLMGTAVAFNNCSKGTNSGQTVTSLGDTCRVADDLASPETIEDVVQIINTLPKPTSLPCFLESLSRPFTVYGSSSSASAQPAQGERSPRIFIFKNNLILAVVPDGISKNLLELSLIKSTGRTLKAEIEFPVKDQLSFSDPFSRIVSGGVTSCALCHSGESRDTSIAYTQAYISKAMRPNAFARVSLDSMKMSSQECNPSKELYRCLMFYSIFKHGPVNDQDFPNSIP